VFYPFWTPVLGRDRFFRDILTHGFDVIKACVHDFLIKALPFARKKPVDKYLRSVGMGSLLQQHDRAIGAGVEARRLLKIRISEFINRKPLSFGFRYSRHE